MLADCIRRQLSVVADQEVAKLASGGDAPFKQRAPFIAAMGLMRGSEPGEVEGAALLAAADFIEVVVAARWMAHSRGAQERRLEDGACPRCGDPMPAASARYWHGCMYCPECAEALDAMAAAAGACGDAAFAQGGRHCSG